jgi:hypothetical protein
MTSKPQPQKKEKKVLVTEKTLSKTEKESDGLSDVSLALFEEILQTAQKKKDDEQAKLVEEKKVDVPTLAVIRKPTGDWEGEIEALEERLGALDVSLDEHMIAEHAPKYLEAVRSIHLVAGLWIKYKKMGKTNPKKYSLFKNLYSECEKSLDILYEHALDLAKKETLADCVCRSRETINQKDLAFNKSDNFFIEYVDAVVHILNTNDDDPSARNDYPLVLKKKMSYISTVIRLKLAKIAKDDEEEDERRALDLDLALEKLDVLEIK